MPTVKFRGYRKNAFLAGACALALLAGCGSSDDDSGDSGDAATTKTTLPAETPATGPAAKKVDAGGVTAAGSKLKVGETAVFDWTDPDPAKKKNSSRIEVTPVSLEKGTLDDFKNIELDADQKTATPYYVKVKIKNAGKGDLTGSDPSATLNGVDDRAQEQSNVVFFGDFDRCDYADAPKSFRPGETFETCQTYLIPKGGSLKGVKWYVINDKDPAKSGDVNWAQ